MIIMRPGILHSRSSDAVRQGAVCCGLAGPLNKDLPGRWEAHWALLMPHLTANSIDTKVHDRCTMEGLPT